MNINKLNIGYKRISREAVIWTAAFIGFAIMDPSVEHMTLCPLNNLGWDFCPGCGLGHSIAYLFDGQLSASVQAHPLGIPAVIILVYRIIQLSVKAIRNN